MKNREVIKMRFAKRDGKPDKTAIVYNAHLTTNNPNDWNAEDPNYIVSLLKKVVAISIESARIINKLLSLEKGK